MKKISLVTCACIVLFFIVNYNAIISEYYNYKGNILYQEWSFTWALAYHNWSLQNKKSPEILHNLWNDSFKIWEENTDLQRKFELYNNALNFYSWSLSIAENFETRENYNYVLEKIIEEFTKQENKGQDKNREEQDENNNDQNQNSSNTWSNSEENSGAQIELSESNMEEIKDYIEKLKRQQAKNWQYFNKEEQSDIDSNNFFFWNFVNDPFFQDVFNRWWEKDW